MTCDDKWPAHKAARFLVVATLASWALAFVAYGAGAWVLLMIWSLFT